MDQPVTFYVVTRLDVQSDPYGEPWDVRTRLYVSATGHVTDRLHDAHRYDSEIDAMERAESASRDHAHQWEARKVTITLT